MSYHKEVIDAVTLIETPLPNDNTNENIPPTVGAHKITPTSDTLFARCSANNIPGTIQNNKTNFMPYKNLSNTAIESQQLPAAITPTDTSKRRIILQKLLILSQSQLFNHQYQIYPHQTKQTMLLDLVTSTTQSVTVATYKPTPNLP